MPFTAVANCAQVQFRTTLNGEITENRIFVDTGSPPDAAMLTVIANICRAWWVDNVVPIVPPELVLREVYCRSMAALSAAEVTDTTDLPAAGTSSETIMPNNVTICASVRTGFTGRGRRGRWYWQGLSEGAIIGNTVQPTPLADIDAALNTLRSDLFDNGTEWVVVSFFDNNAPRGTPLKSLVTDVLFVDATVDSQRRRLPGRGS